MTCEREYEELIMYLYYGGSLPLYIICAIPLMVVAAADSPDFVYMICIGNFAFDHDSLRCFSVCIGGRENELL